MKLQIIPEVGSTPGTTPLGDASGVDRYLRQLHALTLLRLLNPLLRAVQQHRGARLALLEGDDSFDARVLTLRRDIEARFEALGALNRRMGGPIACDEWDALRAAFAERVADGPAAQGLDGFRAHSRLVERLLDLMWRLAREANWFFPVGRPYALGTLNGTETAPPALGNRDHHRMVKLAIRDIPELTETIARIRGLTTHALVMGSCDAAHRSHITGLLQACRHQHQQIRAVPRQLDGALLRRFPALTDTLLHEHELGRLLSQVDGVLIGEPVRDCDVHGLFDRATRVIEAYSAVIDEGLLLAMQSL